MKKILLSFSIMGLSLVSRAQVRFADFKDFIESTGKYTPFEYDISKKFDYCLSAEKIYPGAQIKDVFGNDPRMNRTGDNIWFLVEGTKYRLYFPDSDMLFTVSAVSGGNQEMLTRHLLWFIEQIRGYRQDHRWGVER